VPEADFSQAGGPPGPGVRLEAIDTGVGMSQEVRERIFEPFFTTKKAGEGTGLGLSIVYGIVRQAGGVIAVDSTPDVGTTFRITFPRAPEAEAPVARPEPLRSSAPLAAATVLLAEDDAPLRTLVARALRGANLTVLEAGSGEAALALARAHPGALDLLVTDGVMAGLSGPALAAALRQERPRCAVLVVTGFPSDPEVAAFAGAGGAVMQKPFRASALLEAVRGLLARR
jgi:two-component system cell cycle sensor histidine kinase/response regulator CckA